MSRIAGTRPAMPAMQPLAELEDPRRLLGRSRDGQLGGRAQADDQRDGERPAPEPALVAAAVEQGREPHLGVAPADVQGADPLGAVDLVGRRG